MGLGSRIDASPVDVDGFLDLCRQAAVVACALAKPTIVTWRQEIRHVQPADLINAVFGRIPRAFFWSSPLDGLTFVAAGSALDLVGQGPQRFQEVRQAWQRALDRTVAGGTRCTADPLPALVGGFAFAPGQSSGPTVSAATFPDGLMWLPSVLVVRDRAGACTLVLNKCVYPSDYEPAARSVARMAAILLGSRDRGRKPGSGHRGAGVPDGNVTMASTPTEGDWMDLVARAVRQIHSGSFDKVVLARQVEVRSATEFDVRPALRALLERNPSTTVFAARVDGRSFLGATPERLVRVQGGLVDTMSLAGSSPRGRTPAEDRELADRLLHDTKCREEQQIVTTMVERVLAELCVDIRIPDRPEILPLTDVQHLHSRVRARLANPRDTGVLDLVERLHPTPAVGGHPDRTAVHWLTEAEPLDRGWYAGPIGWLSDDHDGDFAVAIRSARIAGRSALLYAGCGIVADSRPADELAETKLKLRPMLAALGVPPQEQQPETEPDARTAVAVAT